VHGPTLPLHFDLWGCSCQRSIVISKTLAFELFGGRPFERVQLANVRRQISWHGEETGDDILTEDGNPLRIASEIFDVAPDPLKSSYLVRKPIIAVDAALVQGQKSKRVQPVVDRHNHDIAP